MISATSIPSGEHTAGGGSGGATSRVMTYDPYLNNGPERAKVPEFLRPLPKPARYHNGEPLLTSAAAAAYQPRLTNGVRPGIQVPPRPAAKYPQPVQSQRPLEEAVNLVHKRDYNGLASEEYQIQLNKTSSQQQPTRLFMPAPVTSQTPQYTAASAYYASAQYTPLYFTAQQRHQFPPVTPPQYVHVPQYSPPKPGQSVLKAEPTKPITQQSQQQQQQQQQQKPPFKVPSGKEGSLKHRILTRPASGSTPEKRSVHPSGAHFARGSLIQLTNGEFRRIEEMRAEDFVSAAERNPALRLDPSTVVHLAENSQRPHEGTVTLSYGRQGSQQVELEVTLEHPFFVYGKGWASISPERSLQNFGLPCHRLAVGDICIALSPRPTASSSSSPVKPSSTRPGPSTTTTTLSQEAAAELHRKRRWSAPDQFASDDENDPSPPQRTKDTSVF